MFGKDILEGKFAVYIKDLRMVVSLIIDSFILMLNICISELKLNFLIFTDIRGHSETKQGVGLIYLSFN